MQICHEGLHEISQFYPKISFYLLRNEQLFLTCIGSNLKVGISNLDSDVADCKADDRTEWGKSLLVAAGQIESSPTLQFKCLLTIMSFD